MSLDTVAMAYPIDEADLLTPVVGDELAKPATDHDYPAAIWAALSGRAQPLAPEQLLGTPDPGAISFIYADELVDWGDLYADLLGPPLDGEPALGDVRRTPKGTRACALWVRSPEIGTDSQPRPCKRAARDGSAYCGSHDPAEDLFELGDT